MAYRLQLLVNKVFFCFVITFFALESAQAQFFWQRQEVQPEPTPAQRGFIRVPPQHVAPPQNRNTHQQGQQQRQAPQNAQRIAPQTGAQTAYRVREERPRGLFDILFGRRDEPEEFEPEENRQQFEGAVKKLAPKRAAANYSRVVCVRTCDGAFAPISTARRSSRERDQELCDAQCPGTEVKVFLMQGDEIEKSRSIDGENYLSLANALKFQKSHDTNCTCRPKGKNIADLDIDDPTLKKGDSQLSEDQARLMALPNNQREQGRLILRQSKQVLDKREEKIVQEFEAKTYTSVRMIDILRPEEAQNIKIPQKKSTYEILRERGLIKDPAPNGQGG